jgi:hypothetical protein
LRCQDVRYRNDIRGIGTNPNDFRATVNARSKRWRALKGFYYE